MSTKFEKIVNQEDFHKIWNASREAIKSGGKVYRVKSLEWNPENKRFNDVFVESDSEDYLIFINEDIFDVVYRTTGKQFDLGAFSSLDEAKAACQNHYEEQVFKNLEEVEL